MIEQFKKLYCAECGRVRWHKGIHGLFCVVCQTFYTDTTDTPAEIERFIG